MNTRNKKRIKRRKKLQEQEDNKKKPKNIFKKFLIVLFILAFLGGASLGFLLYGPYNGFRDWLITVSQMSMTHQWISELLYSKEEIAEVMKNNRVEEIDEATDVESIETNNVQKEEKVYTNEFEKQLFEENLDKDEYKIYADEKDYRIIKIEGKGYTGLLAAIYDPSKVKTMVSSNIGSTGEYLTTMAKNNNAVLAINGGRFFDSDRHGNGGKPRGVTFANDECKSSYTFGKAGGLIGFNDEDILVLSSTCTVSNAKKLKLRDCVSCGPFLIVNGKASRVIGNGGWGTAPRTTIGQRKDGVVLFLVLDGRLLNRPGAGMNDIIDVMQNYGAYTAANLDGGTSSSMVLNGEVINDPVDASGSHRTRPIATAFGLIE